MASPIAVTSPISMASPITKNLTLLHVLLSLVHETYHPRAILKRYISEAQLAIVQLSFKHSLILLKLPEKFQISRSSRIQLFKKEGLKVIQGQPRSKISKREKGQILSVDKRRQIMHKAPDVSYSKFCINFKSKFHEEFFQILKAMKIRQKKLTKISVTEPYR